MTSTFQGPAGGNVQTLTTVGDVTIDGLCRRTDATEKEAKVLLSAGSGLTFQGANGPRKNVPAGAIDFTDDPPRPGGTDNPAGEGGHQFVSASNENPDQDQQSSAGFPGYSSGNGLVASVGGATFQLEAAAGFDVLGVGDSCVYFGVVSVFP
jgi:hypothetical protein